MNYENALDQALTRLHEEGRYRTFIQIAREKGSFPKAMWTKPDGTKKEITIWCGNDYLGMGQNPIVLEAMHAALEDVGAGSGGTRNISGDTVYHHALEAELADLHHKEAALVFSSAYVANDTTLSTLRRIFPGLVIFSDELNHASMIEGIRRGGGEKRIYRHNDMAHLRELLAAEDPSVPKLIAFEGVYSMDGDFGKVSEICDLAQEFNALTYCDEVHAVGMYGAHGGGAAEKFGETGRVDMFNGTLGKAFGVFGGYIAASAKMIDTLRSYAPGFIFTTSVPPVIAAGATASIRYLKGEEGNKLRAAQQSHASIMKTRFKALGLPMLPSTTHIVPLIIGNPVHTKALSDMLLNDYGIYVQPINFPTVPRGTERFRFTPSPVHDAAEIDRLIRALDELWSQCELNRAKASA